MFRLIFKSAFFHVINMLVMILTSVILARELGVQLYGEYVIILSIVTLVSIPISAGMPTLIVREGAKYSGLLQYDKLKGLLFTTRDLVSYYISIIILALIFYSYIVKVEWLFLIALLLPVFSIVKLNSAFLRSQEHIVAGQLLEIFPTLTWLFMLVLSTTAFNLTLSVELVVYEFVISQLISIIVGSFYTYRRFTPLIRDVSASFEKNNWYRGLAPLTLYSGLNVLNGQVGIIVLGGISLNEVSYFKVAMSSAALVTFGLAAVNIVMGPKISKLYSKGNKIEIQKMITNCSQLVLLVGCCIFIVFFVFASNLIGFFYGPEYLQATSSFKILLFGNLVNAALGSVVLILNMTRNEKVVVKGLFLAIFINLILCLTLVQLYGAVGVAIAATLSMSFWNVYLAIMVFNKTGFISHAFRKK